MVRDTDEGRRKQVLIQDLCRLVRAYQTGAIRERFQ